MAKKSKNQPITFNPLQHIFDIQVNPSRESVSLVLKEEVDLEHQFEGCGKLLPGHYFVNLMSFVLYQMVDNTNEINTGKIKSKNDESRIVFQVIKRGGDYIMLHHIIHWVLQHRTDGLDGAYVESLQNILAGHVFPIVEGSSSVLRKSEPELEPEFLDSFKRTGVKYYHMLVQGKTSNKLQRKITERITNPTQINVYGHGEIIGSDFKLFIRGYSELISGVKQSAAMLLDSLMIKATSEGNNYSID